MRTLILSLALAAPALAEPCRALVNLVGAEGHQVLDVLVSDAPTLNVSSGLAAGSGKSLVQLRRRPRAEYKHRLDARMIDLVATDPRTGKESVWVNTDHDLDPSGDPDTPEFTADHDVIITGIWGPYVGVRVIRGGYAGGAHGYDEPHDQLRLAPGGSKASAFDLVGGNAIIPAAARAIARSVEENGWESPPEASSESLSAATFRLREGKLWFEAFLDCCTWAENHNLLDLGFPVSTPAPMQPGVPVKGWYQAPKSCGPAAITLRDRNLQVRWQKRTHEVAALPAGKVVGVSWVSAKAPRLYQRKPDETRRKALVAESRRVDGKAAVETQLVLLEAALDAAPDHPETLAEVGWLAFRSRRFDVAERYSLRALELALDPKVDGRIRYNLGRIAEANGRPRRALALYKASLARRPNKTVQARAAKLEAQLR